MSETPTNPRLYEALLHFKPDDMTLNAWAVAARVNRNIFNDIRKSGRARTDILDKLLNTAGISYAQFDAFLAPVQSEVVSAGLVGTREMNQAYRGTDPLPPLPLLGTAIGCHIDDLEADVEMVELHLGEVLEYLGRPASLATDKDAYALTIISDSMSPRFEPNERVAVSPRATIAIGDDVIVQLRAKDGGDDRVKMVLIKRLVRRTAAYVELRQFNPDITFRVEQSRVAAMHKVPGRLI
jgi:hypothetical protein